MPNNAVLASRTPGVLTLTLNRPDVLNGLTLDMLALVGEELRRAADDDEIRVVVMTGAGRGFCSGLDLRASGPIDAAELRSHLQNHYSPIIRAIRDLPKPVIAAVNGVAAGAGMSLALAADFRIASESASFIQAFVRIGLVPDAGSSYFLPRLVGMAKALELAMLGDKVSAAEALRIGLVLEVVADGALTDATAQLAARFTQGPFSVGLIKQLIRRSPEHDLDSQLRLEEETQYRAAQSSDFAEGVAAFVEKRSPIYRGQ